MTRKNAHGLDELTDAMVEGAAEELYHQASRGASSWHGAHHQLREEFRSIAKSVIAAGQTAELVARSKRGVLP
jgi:hypothetical protein